ncbi:unnamed protein product [Nippostrongylus brasiliensis]|uniref:Aa_trans domain-containing protein n=1 Tax=Nippostrongylus brasiliensis TaxID=27835 RepID=A0A0N4Y0K8_NIPBR|nr:unnamed protein product [Nippostrongylus brasiliensis]
MLILVKGHEYMGKVAYVTSTAPYLIIIILFFRGVTLEGATDGVHYYLGKPDYARIFKTETWSAALIQICFSLNVGYGGIIVLASYNERTNNCFKDAWIVISGVLVMRLSLAFVAYPQAMAKMPWTPVWAAFFFGMLFFLGISSEVGEFTLNFSYIFEIILIMLERQRVVQLHKVANIAAKASHKFLDYPFLLGVDILSGSSCAY